MDPIILVSIVTLLVALLLSPSVNVGMLAAQPTAMLLSEGDQLVAKGRGFYREALTKFNAALAAAPQGNTEAFLRRANLFKLIDEPAKSARDVQAVLHIYATNARAFHANDEKRAALELKRCLALNPSFPSCVTLVKLQEWTATIERSATQKMWVDVVAGVDAALALESVPFNHARLLHWQCNGYVNLGDVDKGVGTCEAALREHLWRNDRVAVSHAYLSLADLWIINGDLELAREAINNAATMAPITSSERIQTYRQRLQNLEQEASRKNYYTVLGVDKAASEETIHQAYRALARKIHPDRLRSSTASVAEQRKQRRQFIDINEAKAVLLDPVKRKQFDDSQQTLRDIALEISSLLFFYYGGGIVETLGRLVNKAMSLAARPNVDTPSEPTAADDSSDVGGGDAAEPDRYHDSSRSNAPVKSRHYCESSSDVDDVDQSLIRYNDERMAAFSKPCASFPRAVESDVRSGSSWYTRRSLGLDRSRAQLVDEVTMTSETLQRKQLRVVKTYDYRQAQGHSRPAHASALYARLNTRGYEPPIIN